MDLIPQHCISPEDKRQSRTLSNGQAWPMPTRLATPGFIQRAIFAAQIAQNYQIQLLSCAVSDNSRFSIKI